MEPNAIYPLSAFFLVLTAFLWVTQRKQSRLPYAPGPKRLKLLGNLLDMPTRNQWIKFNEMSVKCSA